MKKKLRAALSFICMFVLLGTQTLLRGSWTHEKTYSEEV